MTQTHRIIGIIKYYYYYFSYGHMCGRFNYWWTWNQKRGIYDGIDGWMIWCEWYIICDGSHVLGSQHDGVT